MTPPSGVRIPLPYTVQSQWFSINFFGIAISIHNAWTCENLHKVLPENFFIKDFIFQRISFQGRGLWCVKVAAVVGVHIDCVSRKLHQNYFDTDQHFLCIHRKPEIKMTTSLDNLSLFFNNRGDLHGLNLKKGFWSIKI